VSEGIKKIEINNDISSLDMLSYLPADAAALLASMQQISKNPIPSETVDMIAKMKASTEVIDKNKISSTSSGLNLDVIAEINKPNQTEIVRSVPQEIQKAIEIQNIIEKTKKTKDPKEKFIVYEEGIAFGIVIGKTNKTEVNLMMKDLSKIEYSDFDEELIAFYNDIHLTVLYNDEMIVREMQFGSKYRGSTFKGLKTGDHIEKAIELYGQPKMKSIRGALWNKFGIFCENNFITSIRLMS